MPISATTQANALSVRLTSCETWQSSFIWSMALTLSIPSCSSAVDLLKVSHRLQHDPHFGQLLLGTFECTRQDCKDGSRHAADGRFAGQPDEICCAPASAYGCRPPQKVSNALEFHQIQL
jgi:hypothetical protein